MNSPFQMSFCEVSVNNKNNQIDIQLFHAIHEDYMKEHMDDIVMTNSIDTVYNNINNLIIEKKPYWYYRAGNIYVPMKQSRIIGINNLTVYFKIEKGQLLVFEEINPYIRCKKKPLDIVKYRKKYCKFEDDRYIYDDMKLKSRWYSWLFGRLLHIPRF
jgi:hypothetical protein